MVKVNKRSIGEKLRLADVFGKKVFLTHNGNEKFKTPTGAICSIIFVIFIFAYFLNSMLKVWDHTLKQVSF
jgi:hypothetical protein